MTLEVLNAGLPEGLIGLHAEPGGADRPALAFVRPLVDFIGEDELAVRPLVALLVDDFQFTSGQFDDDLTLLLSPACRKARPFPGCGRL
jgi:hypothetical protein